MHYTFYCFHQFETKDSHTGRHFCFTSIRQERTHGLFVADLSVIYQRFVAGFWLVGTGQLVRLTQRAAIF